MVYVDKTMYIQKMLSTFSRVFLSRPRRFGKSLFLSTLESYFRGESSFFNGLSFSPKEGEALPVIRLDLSTVMSEASLDRELYDRVEAVGKEYGISLKESSSSVAFLSLIRALTKKTKCVILIDEYDKPITAALTGDPGKLEQIVESLKNFYSVIKAEDSRIAFAFITGVSRFSKVSIFSGINNLEDISFNRDYAAICGYTKEELKDSLSSHLNAYSTTQGVSVDSLIGTLKEQYNGYRFTDSDEKVFNPLSVLRSLQYKELKNYWFETATPTFLVHRIREEKREPQEFDSIGGIPLTMESTTTRSVSTIDLMYQTGYLTIQKVEHKRNRAFYTLSWPNREVKDAFYECLILEYGKLPFEQRRVSALIEALHSKDFDAFFSDFNLLLSTIPYSLFVSRESYYHSLLHMVLQVCGMVTHSEKLTSKGRIDIVCETESQVFLFECKLDAPVEEAVLQIEERGYAEQYQGRGISIIAVSFSSAERRVKEWKAL